MYSSSISFMSDLQSDKKLRLIAKYIIAAQACSDGGKSLPTVKAHNSEHYRWGYEGKPAMIEQAIRIIDSMPHSQYTYWCEMAPDQNGCPSLITYFEFNLGGYQGQVSFHTPSNLITPFLKKKSGKGKRTRWNKIRGGSLKACKYLRDYFNL